MDWQSVSIAITALIAAGGLFLQIRGHLRSEREMKLKARDLEIKAQAAEHAGDQVDLLVLNEAREQAQLAIEALSTRVRTLEVTVKDCASHLAECRAEMVRAHAERKQHRRELASCHRERAALLLQLAEARGM